uniref:F-box/kelch-repeat protein At3g18720-like n=1 Tax=Erigeron canadensis TaxID=72917 RepID=UPI001CB93F39|nr:F-box/kelch-repeat protein At3g18720-like [Erigeron canadensis]
MNIETGRVLNRSRSWSDLPIEILSCIADRLSIIELLSFRGTCKDFRSASSAAIAADEYPWLLFHKPNSSECLIHDEPRSVSYKRNIPDLQGATCLASYQGWLLVFKDESVFFFCPFSLAKIALPKFPHNQIEGHVAAFSFLPTSPDCMVAVLNATDKYYNFEINMISKGQSEWTQHKISRCCLSSRLTLATFDHKSKNFWYMDDEKSLLAFSAIDNSWEPRRIQNDPNVARGEPLPYFYWYHYLGDTIEQKRDKLDIEDDEYVVVCGLTFHHPALNFPAVYQNEVVDRSPTKTRMRRAVWIQPRFFEAHPNQHW